MRPYRIVSGISYPRLYTGDNQPREIKGGIGEDRNFYHDESIKLSKNDVDGFVGKPICLEHDKNTEVGHITAAWQDRENHMRITARIYTDTPEGEQTFERINNGNLRGFSVGYDVSCAVDDPDKIVGKRFNEISVCEEPFFQGAEITVAATKKGDYKSDLGILNFKIMAEQKNNTAAPEEPVPLDATNKDSSEIARVHDDLLRKNEEMAAKLATLEEAERVKSERLAQFEQQEEQRRAKYAEDNKAVLAEVLEINKEQMDGADLPEDYIQSTTAAFMAPEAANVIAPIIASARAWKKNKEEQIAQQAKMAEMEEKLKKMSDDQSIAEAHIRASSRRLNLATGTEQVDDSDARRLAVTASGGGEKKLDMSRLFIPQQPNEQERELLQLNYGRQANLSVTASAAEKELAPIPQLPNQNLAASVPNSMRHSDNGKYIFHHLVANSRGFKTAPTLGIKTEKEVLNH